MFSLSVIVPNYNNGLYLSQCIESIAQQSFIPEEVIVVDDCSTDNSKDVINVLSQKYNFIVPVLLENNKGVSNARNVGIAKAKGSYITTMDSDDFYCNKDKLKNEMDLIKKFANFGEEILSYSVTLTVNEKGVLLDGKANKYWRKRQFINGNTLVPLISFSKQARIPRDYCIKRELLIKVGGYSFYKDFYEDLDLLMRVANIGTKFYCTFESGTAYRQTNRGLSRRNQEEHVQTKKEIENTYYKQLKLIQKIECKLRKCLYFLPRSLRASYKNISK